MYGSWTENVELWSNFKGSFENWFSKSSLSRMDNEGGLKNWFFALAAEPNKRIIGRKLILINFFTKLHLNYHTLPVTPFQDLLNCTL